MLRNPTTFIPHWAIYFISTMFLQLSQVFPILSTPVIVFPSAAINQVFGFSAWSRALFSSYSPSARLCLVVLHPEEPLDIAKVLPGRLDNCTGGRTTKSFWYCLVFRKKYFHLVLLIFRVSRLMSWFRVGLGICISGNAESKSSRSLKAGQGQTRKVCWLTKVYLVQ